MESRSGEGGRQKVNFDGFLLTFSRLLNRHATFWRYSTKENSSLAQKAVAKSEFCEFYAPRTMSTALFFLRPMIWFGILPLLFPPFPTLERGKGGKKFCTHLQRRATYFTSGNPTYMCMHSKKKKRGNPLWNAQKARRFRVAKNAFWKQKSLPFRSHPFAKKSETTDFPGIRIIKKSRLWISRLGERKNLSWQTTPCSGGEMVGVKYFYISFCDSKCFCTVVWAHGSRSVTSQAEILNPRFSVADDEKKKRMFLTMATRDSYP